MDLMVVDRRTGRWMEGGAGAGVGERVDGRRGVCCWCAVMCCLAQWGNRRAALCNPALPSLAWPFDTVATWPPVFSLDQYLWASSCLIFCVGVLSINVDSCLLCMFTSSQACCECVYSDLFFTSVYNLSVPLSLFPSVVICCLFLRVYNASVPCSVLVSIQLPTHRPTQITGDCGVPW